MSNSYSRSTHHINLGLVSFFVFKHLSVVRSVKTMTLAPRRYDLNFSTTNTNAYNDLSLLFVVDKMALLAMFLTKNCSYYISAGVTHNLKRHPPTQVVGWCKWLREPFLECRGLFYILCWNQNVHHPTASLPSAELSLQNSWWICARIQHSLEMP